MKERAPTHRPYPGGGGQEDATGRRRLEQALTSTLTGRL